MSQLKQVRVVVAFAMAVGLGLAQDGRDRLYPTLDYRLEASARRGDSEPRRIVLWTNPADACTSAAIGAGVTAIRRGPDWADGLADGPALVRLASDPRVTFVRPPHTAHPVNNGVPLTNAPAQHALGNQGQGSKVCVVDPQFSQFSNAVANGYIPPNVITINYATSPFESGGNHGTSCLKIVHDMAPQAQLYAAHIEADTDIVLAHQWAVSQGCLITSNSYCITAGNFWSAAGDLSHQFVDILSSAGGLAVLAAGNSAGAHTDGLFVDGDSDGSMDWPGFGNSIPVNVFGGSIFSLSWDSWPTTSIDYDLDLLDATGTVIATASNVQNGTQQAYEEIYYGGGAVPGASLRVRLVNLPPGQTHKRVKLFVWGAASFSGAAAHRAGSICLPASVPETLAVAAMHVSHWSNGIIAGYSSFGPSPEDPSLAKPDITAPSAVIDPYYGTFAGTSAAAPHAAGAAALFTTMVPGITQTRGALRSLMRAFADPTGLSTANAPYEFGLGKLTLPSQVLSGYAGAAALTPTAPAPGGTMTLSVGGGPANAPVTVLFDPAQTPALPFAGAAIHCNPFASLVLADGLGALGPATPSAFDGAGAWALPPVIRPPFALGLRGCRIQAAWLGAGGPTLSVPVVFDL